MIDLLSNTKSTAFVEAAFRLLEIQSIRNYRIPSNPINTIFIDADFNAGLYSIYAQLPLTVVPNEQTNLPELDIEEVYAEDTYEQYGSDENLGQLLAVIAFELETEENTIEDTGFSYQPEEMPSDEFDTSEYDASIEWESSPFVLFDINLFDAPPLDEIPTDTGFYNTNPKNIETQIDIEKMILFVTATIPFLATLNSNGEILINPLDYA